MGATFFIQKFGINATLANNHRRRKFSMSQSWPITLQLCETKNGPVYRLYAPECDIRVARSLGFTSNRASYAQTADPKIAQKFIKFADDKTAAHIITSLLTSKEGQIQ